MAAAVVAATDTKAPNSAVAPNPETTKAEESTVGEDKPRDADVRDAAEVASTKNAEESQSLQVTALSAEAPAFVPNASMQADGVQADASDVCASLPPSHRRHLRQGYHAITGEWVAYHIGRLKSFNTRTGYGFIECAQSYKDYGADVFIHKNSMINPWEIGQPIEFAVVCNGKGQPQATDVNWLPRMPTAQNPSSVTRPAAPPVTVATASNGESLAVSDGVGSSAVSSSKGVPQATNHTATAAAAMGADAAAGGSAASQPVTRNASTSSELRRLGTLKSFSPAQGYGFIACEEVFSNYQRDVYFDKSQLPSANWNFGQTVEFMVIHNARGHPQARQIDWNPVPLLKQAQQPGTAGVLGGKPISAGGGPDQKLHSTQTLGHLKKLLRHLHESQAETAVVQAINLQGGNNATGGGSDTDVDPDIDFVTFVLDRLGPEAKAVPKIKDFVKMLLLLMLAKMLRNQTDTNRCQQVIRWFEALSQTIEPAAESVREHLQSVVEQINNQLQSAHRENKMLRDDPQLPVLQAAFRHLQSESSAV